MESYIDILKDWEQKTANPAIYERLDTLFPELSLKRTDPGGEKDHWASALKLDLSRPKKTNPEKTVIYRLDMRFREQGEWDNPVWMMDLLRERRGIKSLYEAYRLASETIGLDMPVPGSDETMETVKRAERRKSLLNDMADYFSWNLENNRYKSAEAVRRYLSKERELRPEDWRAFRLGAVPRWDTVTRHMTEKRGYTMDEIEAACKVTNAEGRTSVGTVYTLAVPYVREGEVTGFLFRRITDGDGPKYRASTGLDRKSSLFNLPDLRDEKMNTGILVVEGEFDTIKATTSGLINVTAMCGSDISGEKRRMIEDAFAKGVRSITLCPDLDLDKDGKPNHEKRREAIMRTIHTIKDVDLRFENIFVVELPYPGDPDSIIRERGRDEFERIIGTRIPYWKYIGKHSIKD